MQKRLCALALAALMLCSCGGEKKGAEKTKKEKPASELTLAQQFSDKLDGGKYDITMNVTGKNYADGMKCRMWGRDGDGGVSMEDNGVYTEFITIDGGTYMLVPEVECYELMDESGGFGNAFIKIGDDDKLVSSDVADGEVTEVFSNEEGDKFTFVFDEKKGELKTFTAEREAGTTVTEIESMSWDCKGVELPDLSTWSDVGENAAISDITQLKFSLYIAGGVTEDDVIAAGYTYEQICAMDLEERNKITDELLGK